MTTYKSAKDAWMVPLMSGWVRNVTERKVKSGKNANKTRTSVMYETPRHLGTVKCRMPRTVGNFLAKNPHLGLTLDNFTFGAFRFSHEPFEIFIQKDESNMSGDNAPQYLSADDVTIPGLVGPAGDCVIPPATFKIENEENSSLKNKRRKRKSITLDPNISCSKKKRTQDMSISDPGVTNPTDCTTYQIPHLSGTAPKSYVQNPDPPIANVFKFEGKKLRKKPSARKSMGRQCHKIIPTKTIEVKPCSVKIGPEDLWKTLKISENPNLETHNSMHKTEAENITTRAAQASFSLSSMVSPARSDTSLASINDTPISISSTEVEHSDLPPSVDKSVLPHVIATNPLSPTLDMSAILQSVAANSLSSTHDKSDVIPFVIASNTLSPPRQRRGASIEAVISRLHTSPKKTPVRVQSASENQIRSVPNISNSAVRRALLTDIQEIINSETSHELNESSDFSSYGSKASTKVDQRVVSDNIHFAQNQDFAAQNIQRENAIIAKKTMKVPRVSTRTVDDMFSLDLNKTTNSVQKGIHLEKAQSPNLLCDESVIDVFGNNSKLEIISILPLHSERENDNSNDSKTQERIDSVTYTSVHDSHIKDLQSRNDLRKNMPKQDSNLEALPKNSNLEPQTDHLKEPLRQNSKLLSQDSNPEALSEFYSPPPVKPGSLLKDSNPAALPEFHSPPPVKRVVETHADMPASLSAVESENGENVEEEGEGVSKSKYGGEAMQPSTNEKSLQNSVQIRHNEAQETQSTSTTPPSIWSIIESPSETDQKHATQCEASESEENFSIKNTPIPPASKVVKNKNDYLYLSHNDEELFEPDYFDETYVQSDTQSEGCSDESDDVSESDDLDTSQGYDVMADEGHNKASPGFKIDKEFLMGRYLKDGAISDISDTNTDFTKSQSEGSTKTEKTCNSQMIQTDKPTKSVETLPSKVQDLPKPKFAPKLENYTIYFLPAESASAEEKQNKTKKVVAKIPSSDVARRFLVKKVGMKQFKRFNIDDVVDGPNGKELKVSDVGKVFETREDADGYMEATSPKVEKIDDVSETRSEVIQIDLLPDLLPGDLPEIEIDEPNQTISKPATSKYNPEPLILEPIFKDNNITNACKVWREMDDVTDADHDVTNEVSIDTLMDMENDGTDDFHMSHPVMTTYEKDKVTLASIASEEDLEYSDIECDGTGDMLLPLVSPRRSKGYSKGMSKIRVAPPVKLKEKPTIKHKMSAIPKAPVIKSPTQSSTNQALSKTELKSLEQLLAEEFTPTKKVAANRDVACIKCTTPDCAPSPSEAKDPIEEVQPKSASDFEEVQPKSASDFVDVQAKSASDFEEVQPKSIADLEGDRSEVEKKLSSLYENNIVEEKLKEVTAKNNESEVHKKVTAKNDESEFLKELTAENVSKVRSEVTAINDESEVHKEVTAENDESEFLQEVTAKNDESEVRKESVAKNDESEVLKAVTAANGESGVLREVAAENDESDFLLNVRTKSENVEELREASPDLGSDSVIADNLDDTLLDTEFDFEKLDLTNIKIVASVESDKRTVVNEERITETDEEEKLKRVVDVSDIKCSKATWMLDQIIQAVPFLGEVLPKKPVTIMVLSKEILICQAVSSAVMITDACNQLAKKSTDDYKENKLHQIIEDHDTKSSNEPVRTSEKIPSAMTPDIQEEPKATNEDIQITKALKLAIADNDSSDKLLSPSDVSSSTKIPKYTNSSFENIVRDSQSAIRVIAKTDCKKPVSGDKPKQANLKDKYPPEQANSDISVTPKQTYDKIGGTSRQTTFEASGTSKRTLATISSNMNNVKSNADMIPTEQSTKDSIGNNMSCQVSVKEKNKIKLITGEVIPQVKPVNESSNTDATHIKAAEEIAVSDPSMKPLTDANRKNEKSSSPEQIKTNKELTGKQIVKTREETSQVIEVGSAVSLGQNARKPLRRPRKSDQKNASEPASSKPRFRLKRPWTKDCDAPVIKSEPESKATKNDDFKLDKKAEVPKISSEHAVNTTKGKIKPSTISKVPLLNSISTKTDKVNKLPSFTERNILKTSEPTVGNKPHTVGGKNIVKISSESVAIKKPPSVVEKHIVKLPTEKSQKERTVTAGNKHTLSSDSTARSNAPFMTSQNVVPSSSQSKVIRTTCKDVKPQHVGEEKVSGKDKIMTGMKTSTSIKPSQSVEAKSAQKKVLSTMIKTSVMSSVSDLCEQKNVNLPSASEKNETIREAKINTDIAVPRTPVPKVQIVSPSVRTQAVKQPVSSISVITASSYDEIQAWSVPIPGVMGNHLTSRSVIQPSSGDLRMVISASQVLPPVTSMTPLTPVTPMSSLTPTTHGFSSTSNDIVTSMTHLTSMTNMASVTSVISMNRMPSVTSTVSTTDPSRTRTPETSEISKNPNEASLNSCNVLKNAQHKSTAGFPIANSTPMRQVMEVMHRTPSNDRTSSTDKQSISSSIETSKDDLGNEVKVKTLKRRVVQPDGSVKTYKVHVKRRKKLRAPVVAPNDLLTSEHTDKVTTKPGDLSVNTTVNDMINQAILGTFTVDDAVEEEKPIIVPEQDKEEEAHMESEPEEGELLIDMSNGDDNSGSAAGVKEYIEPVLATSFAALERRPGEIRKKTLPERGSFAYYMALRANAMLKRFKTISNMFKLGVEYINILTNPEQLPWLREYVECVVDHLYKSRDALNSAMNEFINATRVSLDILRKKHANLPDMRAQIALPCLNVLFKVTTNHQWLTAAQLLFTIDHEKIDNLDDVTSSLSTRGKWCVQAATYVFIGEVGKAVNILSKRDVNWLLEISDDDVMTCNDYKMRHNLLNQILDHVKPIVRKAETDNQSTSETPRDKLNHVITVFQQLLLSADKDAEHLPEYDLIGLRKHYSDLRQLALKLNDVTSMLRLYELGTCSDKLVVSAHQVVQVCEHVATRVDTCSDMYEHVPALVQHLIMCDLHPKQRLGMQVNKFILRSSEGSGIMKLALIAHLQNMCEHLYLLHQQGSSIPPTTCNLTIEFEKTRNKGDPVRKEARVRLLAELRHFHPPLHLQASPLPAAYKNNDTQIVLTEHSVRQALDHVWRRKFAGPDGLPPPPWYPKDAVIKNANNEEKCGPALPPNSTLPAPPLPPPPLSPPPPPPPPPPPTPSRLSDYKPSSQQHRKQTSYQENNEFGVQDSQNSTYPQRQYPPEQSIGSGGYQALGAAFAQPGSSNTYKKPALCVRPQALRVQPQTALNKTQATTRYQSPRRQNQQAVQNTRMNQQQYTSIPASAQGNTPGTPIYDGPVQRPDRQWEQPANYHHYPQPMSATVREHDLNLSLAESTLTAAQSECLKLVCERALKRLRQIMGQHGSRSIPQPVILAEAIASEFCMDHVIPFPERRTLSAELWRELDQFIDEKWDHFVT